MGRHSRLLLMIAALAIAAPCSAATLSAEGRHGRILSVRTGTSDGDCRAEGSRLVCTDGGAIAVADLSTGCAKTEGTAGCAISLLPDDRVEGGSEGTLDEVSTDVECETGAKKGYIYTVSDGDGQGSCAQTRDVAGRVNGAVCTKSRVACATFDCDHGCDSVSLNCGCRVKSRARASATTSD